MLLNATIKNPVVEQRRMLLMFKKDGRGPQILHAPLGFLFEHNINELIQSIACGTHSVLRLDACHFPGCTFCSGDTLQLQMSTLLRGEVFVIDVVADCRWN